MSGETLWFECSIIFLQGFKMKTGSWGTNRILSGGKLAMSIFFAGSELVDFLTPYRVVVDDICRLPDCKVHDAREAQDLSVEGPGPPRFEYCGVLIRATGATETMGRNRRIQSEQLAHGPFRTGMDSVVVAES